MPIYIDVQGTIIGNARLEQRNTIQAVLNLLQLGHEVHLVSGSPGAVLCGLKVEDKLEAWHTIEPGSIVVDDEHLVLVSALRQGCIAVPASQLCALADRLSRSR
jgi:hypothetical protein